jgi:hypothetical protein
MPCGIEATINFTQRHRIGTFGSSGSDTTPREASTGQAPTNFLQNDPANTIDNTRLSVLILSRAN